MLSPRQECADAKRDYQDDSTHEDDLAATSSSRSCMDDFECLSRLGAGSFGTVYKIRRHADNCLYVLKSVRIVELTYKEQTEAINEVTILSQMDSPFVVRYYDSFISKDSLHIIMEYCNRGDLQALVKKAKEKELTCLREHVTWNTSLQVILGLHYLHRKKILHRDLKTANVFLTDSNNGGLGLGGLNGGQGLQYFQVKIGDLGVAKLLETSTAFAKTIVGTPYYLSPELCSDQPYRDKSDCWALGVMMYECCSLQHPFEARNQCALIMKIIQSPVKPPNPTSTSAELSKLIMWLLQKDPVNRPSIRDILSERFVQEKLLEHGLEVPSDILAHGEVTEYIGEYSGVIGKLVAVNVYGENSAGDGNADDSARNSINSSPSEKIAYLQQTADKKARSLNTPVPNPYPTSSNKSVKSIGAIRGNRVRGPPSAKRVLSEQVLTAHQLAPPRTVSNPFSNKRQSAGSRTNDNAGEKLGADSKGDDFCSAERTIYSSMSKEGDNDTTIVVGAKQEKLSFNVDLHALSKEELSEDNCVYAVADSKYDNSNYTPVTGDGDAEGEGGNNNTGNYSYEDDFEDYEDGDAKNNGGGFDATNTDEINKESTFYNIYLGSDDSTGKHSTVDSIDDDGDDNNSTADFEIERLTALASDSRQKLCAMLGDELFIKVYDLCSCRMRRNNASGGDNEQNVSAYVEDEDGEMIDSQIDDRHFVTELEVLFTNSKKKIGDTTIDFSDALVGVQVLLAYEFKLYCFERSRYSAEYMTMVYRK